VQEPRYKFEMKKLKFAVSVLAAHDPMNQKTTSWSQIKARLHSCKHPFFIFFGPNSFAGKK
jgi:hypothetical protein